MVKLTILRAIKVVKTVLWWRDTLLFSQWSLTSPPLTFDLCNADHSVSNEILIHSLLSKSEHVVWLIAGLPPGYRITLFLLVLAQPQQSRAPRTAGYSKWLTLCFPTQQGLRSPLFQMSVCLWSADENLSNHQEPCHFSVCDLGRIWISLSLQPQSVL